MSALQNAQLKAMKDKFEAEMAEKARNAHQFIPNLWAQQIGAQVAQQNVAFQKAMAQAKAAPTAGAPGPLASGVDSLASRVIQREVNDMIEGSFKKAVGSLRKFSVALEVTVHRTYNLAQDSIVCTAEATPVVYLDKGAQLSRPVADKLGYRWVEPSGISLMEPSQAQAMRQALVDQCVHALHRATIGLMPELAKLAATTLPRGAERLP